MKRLSFHIVAAVSLVLCVAAMVAWWRARRLPVSCVNLFYDARTQVYGQNHFDNTRQAVAFFYLREKLADPAVAAFENRTYPVGFSSWIVLRWAPDAAGRIWWERLGFWLDIRHKPELSPRDRATYCYISAPHWFTVLVTGILPTTWLIAHMRRRHRGVRGLCPGCGYDLRASAARCPECGMKIGAEFAATG